MRTNTNQELATNSGLVYEKNGNYYRTIYPIPILTRASCNFLPDLASNREGPPVIFREDSFNSKVRRGRLYVNNEGERLNLQSITIENIHNYPFGKLRGDDWLPERLYRSVQPKEIATYATPFKMAMLELGDNKRTTLWRVTAIECISNGELMFTLRPLSSLRTLLAMAHGRSSRK